MDVDSDTSDGITSSDSGVGTSPSVNVDKCLPVAREEICKQEREEDASSVSSVEYHYSEEEYYQSGDDIDEDDVDKEIGMTNSTTTEKSEEIVSITDLALKYNLQLISDSEVEDEKGSWKPIFDSDKGGEEDCSSRKHVCLPMKVLQEDVQCRSKPFLGPQFEFWVNSWKVKNHETRFAWVNVYAYHNKKKGYGGYGVILRDSQAKPVTASAMYSADAKSFFTQVLMGVKAGVILAEKHGISELCVESNSTQIPTLVNLLWNCRTDKCRDGTGICKTCLGSFFGYAGSDPSLVHLAREIKARAPKGQHLNDLLQYPRSLNKAARYLAKMGKKNGRKVENKGGMVPRGDEWPAEVQPGDFPEELKVMLFEQAFGRKYYNDLSGW